MGVGGPDELDEGARDPVADEEYARCGPSPDAGRRVNHHSAANRTMPSSSAS